MMEAGFFLVILFSRPLLTKCKKNYGDSFARFHRRSQNVKKVSKQSGFSPQSKHLKLIKLVTGHSKTVSFDIFNASESKMHCLSEIEVARAVALLEDGRSMRYVANQLHSTPSVICRAWHRYQETGTYSRRIGQGRKRKTTPRDDRYIVISCLRRRTATARELQNLLRNATDVTISDQTVRRRLKEVNMTSRRPVRAPRLSRNHKVSRLNFAREHLQWQLRHWRSVLFTDESRFCLTRCDGRVRVYRRPGERYTAACIQEVDRFGAGSVMVWGGISIDGRTDLVVVPQRLNAQIYVETILQEHVMPFADNFGHGFILQQDNCRVHTANLTTNFLREQEIQVMGWPAMSPDLNAIEHVWDLLDRRIRKRPAAPQTLRGLAEALVEEWRNLPQDMLRRLIRSMPRRCQAVIAANGGHTRY